MVITRRFLPLITLLAFTACQDSGDGDPTSPQLDGLALFSRISPQTTVAVPVTIPQVSGGPMYPGPVGIAVAPLESLESFRLMNPLEGGEAEGVAQYVSVSFLPGGKEALATATIPSEVPSYDLGLGLGYLVKFDVKTGVQTGKVLLEGVPGLLWDEGGSAWRMAVSRDGKIAYVSLIYGAAIAVVDLRSMELLRYISLPTPSESPSNYFYPWDVELIEADKALLVNDQVTGQVLRIDTDSFEIQEVYYQGRGNSTSITVSNDGRILLISSREYLNVVDLQSATQVAQIPCLRPTGHQFLPGDREVAVTCRDEDRLIVVGRKDWSVLWEMPITGGPHRVSVEQSGRFAILSTWSTNELVLVDLSKREILKRVTMPNRLWAPVFWPGHSVD